MSFSSFRVFFSTSSSTESYFSAHLPGFVKARRGPQGAGRALVLLLLVLAHFQL